MADHEPLSIVRASRRETEGAWSKLRIECWVRDTDPKAAAVAILNPAIRELAFPDIEPASQLDVDTFAVYVDENYIQGVVS